ncbi:unnamed protein product [Miscanthus lutarioriparius]|uniref:Uncharacterized protein n=1 Tax=Miscanthus lutarioriparius TaxID=422564 RepID=A0A811QE37_9POAL|nr:unnamed protein product [Miscanthus lutarioriparius]
MEQAGMVHVHSFMDQSKGEETFPQDAWRTPNKDAALVVVLSDAGGVDELFFGVEGIAKGLRAGSIVLIRSTLLLSQLEKLEQKLTDEKDVFLLDGYIFSGLSDELKQQIIIVASGRQDVSERARKFFHSLYNTVYFAEGEFCTSSKLRVVNDLLEGIHFVASIEAMYLGVRAGIHPSIIYDIISNAAGSSRIFVELVPKLLSGDPLLIDFLNSARKKCRGGSRAGLPGCSPDESM